MKNIAVITGDVINSREGNAQSWLKDLKAVLKQYGSTPGDWEIVRGDSFQLRIPPRLALLAAFHIKAGVRQNPLYDVRLAIGIGEESHRSKRISESNGSAYVRSGEAFETLRKNTLMVNSGNAKKDEVLQLLLRLAQLTANQWKSTSSQVIKTVIEHPDKNQSEIAELLQKSQSSISEALNRGGFDEITQLNRYFEDQFPNE